MFKYSSGFLDFMENKPSYDEVLAFQAQLDKEAIELSTLVNNFYQNLRLENKAKWEKFAKTAKIPIIGELYSKIFKAPKGLKKEKDWSSLNEDYYLSDFKNWFKPKAKKIYEKAETLEKMKGKDLEHWGDEKVEAYYGWDYTGDYNPRGPIPRKEAYKPYDSGKGPIDDLEILVARKYDFVNWWGIAWNRHFGSLSDGIFVMDSKTKDVVPLNKCEEKENQSSFGWLSRKFGRTPVLYRYTG